MQTLTIAVLGGIGGMLGWGFADFLAKKTVDSIGSIASLVWAHIFGMFILVLVTLYALFILRMPLVVPSGLITWLGLIFFGTLQTIVYFLLYSGLEKGQVSLLNPVFSTYSGVVALISILFFGEIEATNHLFGLIAVFIGILSLNVDINALRSKRIKLNKISGLNEVALAALLAVAWTLSWDKFINGHNWLTYALFMYAFMALSAVIFAKLQKANLKVLKPNIWKFLLLIGLGEVIAYIAISLGFSSTQYTSIVAVLSGASALPTIILARIFLKEKVTTIQTIGTLIIIAGVAVVSL
jgi:drug/metabolite transporter (DMT)-like permease